MAYKSILVMLKKKAWSNQKNSRTAKAFLQARQRRKYDLQIQVGFYATEFHQKHINVINYVVLST
ncbi:unnamed protein product [Linum tenue]|uniref:Ribosomal protein L20 n=1 Tax=Linum tenue TaxID=586396 RepID=A0AAV0QQT8_9ROSI|nr:unnamed protein product [Linum tenue]CAI0551151.1 unnamed protein product [Linum tenue]